MCHGLISMAYTNKVVTLSEAKGLPLGFEWRFGWPIRSSSARRDAGKCSNRGDTEKTLFEFVNRE